MNRIDKIKKLALPSDAKVLQQINLKELKKATSPPKDKSKLKNYYSDLNNKAKKGPKYTEGNIKQISDIQTKLTREQLIKITQLANRMEELSFLNATYEQYGEQSKIETIIQFLQERNDVDGRFIDWAITNVNNINPENDFGLLIYIYDSFMDNEELATRILSSNYNDAVRLSREWHAQFEEGYEGEVEHRAEVVREYDNMRLVKLTTKEELDEEGRMMGHCVGSYYEQVKAGNLEIYSLRNSSGPHVTFEIQGSSAQQIKGKQNKPPVDKYLPVVKQAIMDMDWSPLCEDFKEIKWGETPEEKEYLKGMAETMAKHNVRGFLTYKLYTTFPKLGYKVAKKIIEGSVHGLSAFFSSSLFNLNDNLNEVYPDLERQLAIRLSEKLNSNHEYIHFFDYRLNEKYPDLEYEFAKKLMSQEGREDGWDEVFFDYGLDKKYQQLIKKVSKFDQINKLAVPSDAKALQQINLKELKKNNPPPEDKSLLREYYFGLNEEAKSGPKYDWASINYIDKNVKSKLTRKQIIKVLTVLNEGYGEITVLLSFLERRVDVDPRFLEWMFKYWDALENRSSFFDGIDVNHIYDGFQISEEFASQFPQINLNNAFYGAENAHRHKTREGEVEHRAEVIKEYDNMRLVKLTTKEELDEEGKMMGHCVGSYYKQVKDGNLEIYSLRDSKGPHVTFEIQGSSAQQIKGKQNKPPIEKYLPITRKIIIDMEWEFNTGSHDIWFLKWEEGESAEEKNISQRIKVAEEQIINDEDWHRFFQLRLQKKYPDVGRPVAEEWAREGNNMFFELELEEKYHELGVELTKKWALEGNTNFHNYGLQKIFPEIFPGLSAVYEQNKKASRFDKIYKLANSISLYHYAPKEAYEDIKEKGLMSYASRFDLINKIASGDSTNYPEELLEKMAVPSDAKVLQQVNLKELKKNNPIPGDKSQLREYYSKLNEDARYGPVYLSEVIRLITKLQTKLTRNQLFWISEDSDSYVHTYHQDLLLGLIEDRQINSLFIDWLIGQNEKDVMNYSPSNLRHIYDAFSDDDEIANNILTGDCQNADQVADRWHEQFEEGYEGEVKHRAQVIKEYGDIRLVKLTTQEELDEEGRMMGHCVGSYYEQVKNGNLEIYSLRNSSGPHVTFEIQGSNTYQIKGKQNKPPIEKYLSVVKQAVMDMEWNPICSDDFGGINWGQTKEEQDYLRPKAEEMVKVHNNLNFFNFGLHNAYPDLGEMLAERLVEGDDMRFFAYDLQKLYPKLGKRMAEDWAMHKISFFWHQEIYKMYPELGKRTAIEMVEKKQYDRIRYFEIHKIYPEIMETIAKNLAETGHPDYIVGKFNIKYPEFMSLYEQNKTASRKNEIKRLAGLLQIPPEMEKDIIDFIKFSYNHFVNKFGDNKFPKVSEPKSLEIYDAGDEGLGIKIPVSFKNWYFDESEDALFEKLFKVQGWDEGDDTHMWDEGAITIIFDLRDMSKNSYGADYDHRTKLMSIRPAESMFHPFDEKDYQMKEAELVAIALHEGVHVAQNIFDTIKKFDYPGKSGVGPEEKYETMESGTILEPKELHSYIREAVEEFKQRRREHPDIEIKRLIKVFLYLWLRDKVHRLRLNPEVWRIFLKKFYEEVSELNVLDRGEKLAKMIDTLSKEGRDFDLSESYIYYPPTGQLISGQTTHQLILHKRFSEMDWLSDQEKEVMSKTDNSRAEYSGTEDRRVAFEKMQEECILVNRSLRAITLSMPRKNSFYLNESQLLLMRINARGYIEAIQFANDSDGLGHISTEGFFIADSWEELSYFSADDGILSNKIAKHNYKEKRKEESGNITYVYDEKHVEKRTKKKSGQVEKLRKSIPKLRAQIKKDLSSDDDKTKYTALVAALIDETYERVGNKKSAEEHKHYGVTRWLVKHVTFSGSTAKIKYVGKSGVNQEKRVSTSKVVSVLKEACKDKAKNDRIFQEDNFMVNRKTVNIYLKDFNITTKDIRGFHANDEMLTQLKKARSGNLPKDTKEKEDKLKEEFTKALEETAKIVGHEASTLKNQYLVPNLETSFMANGKIISSLGSLFRTYDIIKTAEAKSDFLRADLIYKLAGIRENLIKKYPDLKEYILEVEHKIDKRYLTWFAKQLVNFENKEFGATQLYDYITEFKNHQQLLENKDLYQYNFQSLQKTISEIKKQKHEARSGAKQYFELLKQNRKLYRDLNMDRKEIRSKSYEDGRKFLNNIEPKSFQSFVRQEISKVIEEREKAKGTEGTARENSDIIFEDENYLVVLPGTEQASKYFGSGTEWCTAAEENNMFVTYSSKNIYLYYILNKQNDDKHAYTIAKTENSIQLDIRDIVDLQISKATLSKTLGEDYDKIVPAIKQDNEGRKETKFDEIIKTMSPEELKQNLDSIKSKKNKIQMLECVIDKTANEDVGEYANQQLYLIIEEMIENRNYFFFTTERNKEYPDVEKRIAEKWAECGEQKFFYYYLDEKYPDLARKCVEKMVENEDYSSIFRDMLEKEYPDLARKCAEKMVENEVYSFFFSRQFKLDEKYPDLARKCAEKMVENEDYSMFFFRQFKLNEKYPDLERLVAEKFVIEEKDYSRYFFNYKLNEKYPDLERALAQVWAKRGLVYSFFKEEFDKKYPDLERKCAEKMVENEDYSIDFLRYELDKKYPDLAKIYEQQPRTKRNDDYDYFNSKSYQGETDKTASRRDLIYKLAGIRENLIKKYPDLKKYILEVEHKIDKKYLTWFTKQLVNFENKQSGAVQLYDYIIEFKNHQQLLESKDLYQYNFQSLQKAISEIKKQKHEAREVAKQYYQLLKQKREEYRNLNMDRKEVRAKSYEDGRRFLDNIKPKSFQSFVRQEISKVIEERERLRGLEKTARENSDVIFEDENYLVVLPGTEQASKYFGSGTQWCTAAEKDNMFVTYSSNNVYLYYILNKENDDKHAYVIAKYDNSIQLEIRDIADVEISKADLSKALGEYYDKIIPAINRDNEGREETKFEEILTKIGPEDLKLNLDAVDADHSKVELLNNVDNKTEREDTKKFIAAELFSIAKRIIGSESDNLYIIFDYNLNNRFPDLEYSAAQIASKRGYTEFFDYSLYEKYPELEMAAAKKLAENDNFSFTTRKLHRRYPDLGKMVAEKMADSVDDYFFSCNFHEMYPDLERKLAESAADLGRDKVFFKYSLEKKYPDLERKLAEKLINGRASSFFYHGLDRTYPDLIGKEHAERVARYSSRIFFEYGLYKKYPELERLSVEALVEDEDFKTFLDFSFLGRKYPELERKMAETFVSRDDAHFFYANFDKKYPGLERQLAEQWAQKSNSDFINFDLGRKYPDLKKVYMKVAIDINDRLIRLGNKLEDSGFKTYAKKVDNLIDCPFDNCNIAY